MLMLLVVSTKALGADVTGLWRYEEIPDSQVIISQDGNVLYISACHALNGAPAAVISYGIGVIDGDKIKLQFKAVRRPNSTWGGANGVTYEELTVSPDGKTITGTWRNDVGQGAAAKLIRVH